MPVVKVTDLAFVRVRAPDFEQARSFFKDLGLIEVGTDGDLLSFRGLGPEREILAVEPGPSGLAAVGFAVAQRSDLDRFATAANGTISPRSGQGGGWEAVAYDPDGNRVELVWGISPFEPISVSCLPMNDSSDRQRRRGDVRRPRSGRPSHILRLGHVVLTTPQPQQLARWYREVFGFLVSDEIFAGSEDNVLLSFNRIDRGDEFVDHHVFQTLAGPLGGIHHISFEVLDIDDLQVGSAYLAEKGHRHMWGVGRHKQGSQIFDYWIDPFGVMYEHWTDTDLLNAASVPGKESIETAQGAWGPPMPPEFITQVG